MYSISRQLQYKIRKRSQEKGLFSFGDSFNHVLMDAEEKRLWQKWKCTQSQGMTFISSLSTIFRQLSYSIYFT